MDLPAGPGLLEAAADPVFTGSLDLPAANDATFGQALCIVQASRLMRSLP